MKSLFKILSLCLFLSAYSLNAQSFLASGKWVQIQIDNSGIHKITKSDLSKMGLDVQNTDPRNFQLFGIQGAELSQMNFSAPSPQSPEIPIYIEGESDGKWDDADYILFYGQASIDWIFSGGDYKNFTNFYASHTSMILGSGANKGKRIQDQPGFVGAITNTYSGNEIYLKHDSDIVNPAGMGRTWFGEKFGNETLNRTFVTKVPSYIDSVWVKFTFAATMVDDTGSLVINANGRSLRYNLRAIFGSYENYTYTEKFFKIPVIGGAVSLQFKLNRPNTKSYGYLDFYEITSSSPDKLPSANITLTPTANTFIRHAQLASDPSNVAYEFTSSISNCKMWNVSRPIEPANLVLLPNTGNKFSVLLNGKIDHHTFVCFDPNASDFFKPKFIKSIGNQNIAFNGAYEFVIITHPNFIKAANALKSFREAAPTNFKTLVVTPQEIYNEFSGGMQDLVAIRNFLRWQYKYSASQGTKLRFVTLFGAASYDMQDRVADNTNFIPVYQSSNNNANFSLDDFLGYLDSAEGDPEIIKSKLTVPVGRIPCYTLEEALGVVDKLKRYSSPQALGPWRANIAFGCDDADESWETEFVQESEKNAQYINQFYPYLNVNKLYSDAFKQSTTGNNESYPDMSAAINRNMKDGVLFFNYQGHGGLKGWAQESILDIPMINSWENSYRMPIMFTATCEFSQYDDPKSKSAGVLSLLNPKGGAIALMSTTRLVYVSGNTQINSDFWTKYGFPRPNEPIPTLGEVFQKMKNRPPPYNSEDNKFALLGDASMPIAFPKHIIAVDSVNGKLLSAFRDTVKAFSIITLKGHVNERLVGEFNKFNGTMWVKVFDKPSQKFTLNNDKSASPVPFLEQSGVLFNGQVTVTNGKFQLVFSVPKDISYNYGIGVAKFYAHNGETDAAGSWQFIIGGSEVGVNPGSDGPIVRSFMQDTTFVSGGKVARDVDFVARIYDKDGINATGAGIGRDLLLVIDEGTENQRSFVLNDYFTYDVNSYTTGTVRFPLTGLQPGKHVLTCKAWDIYNNGGKGSVECLVIPPRTFEITESNSFPVPFDGRESSGSAGSQPFTVSVRHTLPGENITSNWMIFDATGREVRRGEAWFESAQNKVDAMVWDGRSNSGEQLMGGIYFYQILLTTEDGLKQSVGGKFIKL